MHDNIVFIMSACTPPVKKFLNSKVFKDVSSAQAFIYFNLKYYMY